jgi:hypothetical protein
MMRFMFITLALVAAGLLSVPIQVHSQAFLPTTIMEAINASLYLDKFRAAAEAAGYG